MTINKEKWQELAEKYDTKAKWADALLLLNFEEHEDLISALIELDPQDLAGETKGTEIYVNLGNPGTSAPIAEVKDLDVTKIRDSVQDHLDEVDRILDESREAQASLENRMDAIDDELKESLDFISSKLENAETHYHFNGREVTSTSPGEIVKIINRGLGRDT